jgi:ectoine hydroxylase-related dioxygenase (phytanoyl-CoA dioxygenase family)
MIDGLVSGSLSPDMVGSFLDQGFLAIDRLICAEEVAEIRAVLMRLHDTNAGFDEGAQFDAAGEADNLGVRRFPQILHPHVYAPELARTNYHRVGREIAKQLLGPRARFKDDISFMKPPGVGSETPWHQDDAFGSPYVDHNEITIWLALTETDTQNSCMSFIPGSNRLPVLEHRPMGNNPRVHALECLGGFNPNDAVECPLPAGGATIHTHRTLHYAGPNQSDRCRIAYALLFDTPGQPRVDARPFTWAKAVTDRAGRERDWMRRGGLLVYMWRQRHRLATRFWVALRRSLR